MTLIFVLQLFMDLPYFTYTFNKIKILPLSVKQTSMPSGVFIGLKIGKGQASVNSVRPQHPFHPPRASAGNPGRPEREGTCELLPGGRAARPPRGRSDGARSRPRGPQSPSQLLSSAALCQRSPKTQAVASGCHVPTPALGHEPLHQENRKRAGLLLPSGHALSRAAAPCGRRVPASGQRHIGACMAVSPSPPRGREC